MGLEIEQLLSKVSFSLDFEMSQMFFFKYQLLEGIHMVMNNYNLM